LLYCLNIAILASIEVLVNSFQPANIIMSMWYKMNIQHVRMTKITGLKEKEKSMRNTHPSSRPPFHKQDINSRSNIFVKLI
jgi:hypothetical protein